MSKSLHVSSATMALALALLTASSEYAHSESLTLYVAPNGNDAWSGRHAEPGDHDGPLATLERARDEIRRLKSKAPCRPE